MFSMLAQDSSAGSWAQQWRDTFVSAMTELWTKVASFVPNLVGMIVILIIGYFVSKLLQRIAAAILRRIGFDTASQRIGVRDMLDRAGIVTTASAIVGKLVFWLFMLTFLISAAETLGLQNVSQTIDSFVGYLPRVIGAVVILVVGLLIAHFLRDVIRGGAESIGVEYARAVSQIAYGVLLVVIVTLAIGQLQIETTLINRVVEITLMAAGAALALALGLGTRDLARHIVAGVYVRDLYRAGARVTVGDQEGTVDQVGAVSTSITTDGGRIVHIPNGQLIESVVREESRKKDG